MPDILQKTYPNGQRLLIAPSKGTQAVTAMVLYHVGSRYETPQNNGVSHFVEHLMFKGTERRPTTLDLSKELDRFGAEYNAFTSKDHTGYYIKINAEHLNSALDILSDMLQYSTFQQEEIDRERSVIVEEISMYEDNPIMYVEDIFEQLLFGNGTPLGRHIAGPRSVIRSISRNAILKYRDAHYQPSNRLIVLAGKVPSRAEKLVSSYFDGTGNRVPQPRYPKSPYHQRSPRAVVHHKDTEQVQLCLGYPGLSYTHRDAPVADLLSVVLGGNMSSRLFISIRERKGLAYSVRSGSDSYEDIGAFSVQAGVHRKRVTEALQAILAELEKVRTDGITPEELSDAKEHLRGQTTLQLENSGALATFYGRQRLLADRVHTPEQRLRQLAKVTRKDVLRVARKILVPQRANLAMIGPYRSIVPFEKILRMVAKE